VTYPEVSANVQGFVRSRTALPSIYLFVDTGAGTVDVSVFIYARGDSERLTYLGSGVFALGSCWIERLACERLGQISPADLERLRLDKEANRNHSALDFAKNRLRCDLTPSVLGVLAEVKSKKLFRPRQLFDLRVIYGGGGHTENPYARGVRESFKAEIFRAGFSPPEVGLPDASDLQLPARVNQGEWRRRLSVAYGLSYPSYELTPFMLPCEVSEPREIWQPRAEIAEYISQEMC
jgi:hypothetical protein